MSPRQVRPPLKRLPEPEGPDEIRERIELLKKLRDSQLGESAEVEIERLSKRIKDKDGRVD
jgi:hypothetical protein